jgi:hypothetical protein
VWIVDDKDCLRRQAVEVGAVRDSRTEVTDGLSGGERVAIAPPGNHEGQRVKISR